MRFQAIAPTRAAATMTWPSSPPGIVTIPAATNFATAVPASAPRKFAVADMRMAWYGRRARVETDVAIALAVSWKPLT
jgi:hypothetical protein